MFEQKALQSLNEYFTPLSARRSKGVFFYRISAYNEEMKAFIRKYYDDARQNGVIIEGKIANPDEKNLSYYEEIMGKSFQMSMGFLTGSLKKWLPRMNDQQRGNVAMSLYDTLDGLKKEGKNDNMLFNAYIKFMCWLYYRFERIMNSLGNDKLPKILYEGTVSNYELKMLVILAGAGCDVVLLQYRPDAEYLKLDPQSRYSRPYNTSGTSFPEGFSLEQLRKEAMQEQQTRRLYGDQPRLTNCTNAWIEGRGYDDILKSPQMRGNDPNLFYNCFIRYSGVEDKLLFINDLYQLYMQIKGSGRKTVIIEQQIPAPDMDEIAAVKRKNYTSQDQLLADMALNIQFSQVLDLQKLMVKAFVDIMNEEGKLPGMNLNRLLNKAVYVLSWLRRYQSDLFGGWAYPSLSCFFYLGGCRNENEALFLRILARLPVDVIVWKPDLNAGCCLSDPALYEVNHMESLTVHKFPQGGGEMQMGTAAYHAERELDTIMYQDSGMYRNQQYQQALSVTLRTTYEEIGILWGQDLKYRPNFSITGDVVNVPVIFAKVSGVKGGITQKQQYWSVIKDLMIEDVLVIKNSPFINDMPSPMKDSAPGLLKNGKLQKSRIKEHKSYQYGFLREETQNHILDKLQALIDQRIIRGTFENGTEYAIISIILNMPKEVLRLLQKFDFTKRNPKVIYLNTTERMITLEESILIAFLNLAGFDILFFIPTGYSNVENYFTRELIEEHQFGEYIYDLVLPDFKSVSPASKLTWKDKLFRRG